MAGNHNFNRAAQLQFEALNADGKKTLCKAYTATPEDIEWETEMVFSRKRNQKTVQVSFDTKLKRYTIPESNTEVPENEAIKINLGNMFIHYRYHIKRKVHVHIPDPPRSEFGAKYVTMAQNCHLIKGRNITVSVLLAYTVQKANANTMSL